MAFILLAGLLLASLQPSTTAHANSGFAYYWSLTFDFADNATGRLYVAVGYNDNGDVQQPPIYAQTYAVRCTRKGNATVAGGMLQLNGGYLGCDLNIKGALEETVKVCNAIVPECKIEIADVEGYANFRAMANVMSASPGEAPIFYHKDASYAIYPQTSLTQIAGSLTPHGAIPSTPMVSSPALNVLKNYRADYLCDPTCEMYYSVGGSVEVVVTANADVQFFTPSTTIYIGHNPATGVTAPAGTSIDWLFVDPPNYGNN